MLGSASKDHRIGSTPKTKLTKSMRSASIVWENRQFPYYPKGILVKLNHHTQVFQQRTNNLRHDHFKCSQVSLWRGTIYHEITYGDTMTAAERK